MATKTNIPWQYQDLERLARKARRLLKKYANECSVGKQDERTAYCLLDTAIKWIEKGDSWL